jgi:hypothetical protein
VGILSSPLKKEFKEAFDGEIMQLELKNMQRKP